ncbi:Wzz/FepE/Etk N-terminal domain-containing protein [Fusobacterium sp.]|uniref:Wzz/FepE/Etk N-terminal domain-containing protein n=1 Tax=Fusobacterium sp. TaxID=68766 RepID=UPI00396CDB57
MNQLDERKNYYIEDESELDLLDLVRTLIKHKGTVILCTVIFMVISVIGGYFYNKSKSVTTAVLTLNYPGRENGKTPDGGLLTSEEIVPIDVLNSVYQKYKDEIKEKDSKKFIENTELVWMVPSHIQKRIKDAAEKGEKYIYIPTDFAIESKENAKIVNAIALEAVDQFIKRYRPYYEIKPLELNPDYDYSVDYELINDKISVLRTLINDREKKRFVSNKLGFSFDKILRDLNSLEKIEVQDYYSYYTGHHLSLDAKTREIRYKTDIQALNYEKDGLKLKSAIIKKMIDEYKPSENNFVVTGLGEVDKKVTQNDEYYGKMIEQYLQLNKEVVEVDVKIKKLENELKVEFNYPTEVQKKEMQEKLSIIVKMINNLISETNQLNDEYIRERYSNMISISSPVVVTTTGKPLYMYLAVGIALGLCFGIFMAFIAELKEDYRKRYSK